MAGAGVHGLTPREVAVLAAVERRVTNAEIAAELFISLRTVESHIAALRRKLDVDSRAGLISAARDRRGTAVPVPANSFLGRDHDLNLLRSLLAQHRFVSVVGVAGCGKTRLAFELAATDARVPVIAELERARADEVTAMVAAAIGVGPDAGADPVAACGLALDGQRYLLVLDNCDRVTVAVAALVRALLAVSSSVSVLATSRSPVGGDTVHALAPLDVEAPDSPGVRLFLDRAGTERRPGPDDRSLAARICRRLDGLPLAIELAAARVRHLPLAELADRLDEGFGTLEQAGAAGRHRTLRTAFAWTWDLLDEVERAGLARVAALPGPFDLATAAAVGAPEPVVLGLLDRSLLVTASSTYGPQRFRLLAPMRAFVLDLTDFALPHEVRSLHARHVQILAAGLRARARTDDSAEAVRAWRRHAGDICDALEWSLQNPDETMADLARSVGVLVEQWGADRRSLDLLARAARDAHVLQRADDTTLFEMGMALTFGDLEAMETVSSTLLARADGDRSVMLAHELAGFAAGYLDRTASALAHLAEAEHLAQSLGETWHVASARQARGIALRRSNDTLPATVEAFEASMTAYVQAGDAAHVNNVRYMIASTLAQLGQRTEQAMAWADECVEYARSNGNRHELAHAQLTRAMLDAPAAEAGLVEAIDAFRAVGDLRCLTRSSLALAARRPPSERVALLEQALDVASRAHDGAHQGTALELLARARWRAGEHRSAALTAGSLAWLVGREAALERLSDLRTDLEHWALALAEGEARGLPSLR